MNRLDALQKLKEYIGPCREVESYRVNGGWEFLVDRGGSKSVFRVYNNGEVTER